MISWLAGLHVGGTKNNLYEVGGDYGRGKQNAES